MLMSQRRGYRVRILVHNPPSRLPIELTRVIGRAAGDASQASSKIKQEMHSGNKQVGGPTEDVMARAGRAIDSTARDGSFPCPHH